MAQIVLNGLVEGHLATDGYYSNSQSCVWTNNPVVIFTIIDEHSGGATTYFTIDGTEPNFLSPSGNQIEFSSSGIYTIKFFSIDNAGNVETTQTKTLCLDLESPVISNFQPIDCIILPGTTEITFKLNDDLSGIDINKTKIVVDGIEYSTSKNSSYFHFTRTNIHSAKEYNVSINPIQGVLNFNDIQILKVYTYDLAGNYDLFEYNFVPADVTPPKIKELFPIPNATDVSLKSNVIVNLVDYESGVDIKSVKVQINQDIYKLNVFSILNIQYTGTAETATIEILNNTLRTKINGQRDVNISFYDVNYSTIQKVNDYINSLDFYTSEIIDENFNQHSSKDILTISEKSILLEKYSLELFILENNLNFAFLEKENGYLIFVTPNYSFEHKVQVNVKISAADNIGNKMLDYSYIFVPHVTATSSLDYRFDLHKCSLTYLKNLQEYLPSNYSRSKSTNFYGHHKALSLELCRMFQELIDIDKDASFSSVRPEYLYEKLGYLFFTKPNSIFSHQDYRRLLVSLASIFYKGSKKDVIEDGIALFTGFDVKIRELVFDETLDISYQFIVAIDMFVNDSNFTNYDLQTISENLTAYFNLVKPAHIFMMQRFIWSEKFNFHAGCTYLFEEDNHGPILDSFGNKIPLLDDSGFQQIVPNDSGSICDVNKWILNTKFSDDTRIDCSDLQTEIKTITEDVSTQFNGTEDIISTMFKPLLKSTPDPVIAEISDIIITVNSISVIPLEFDAINGKIKLPFIPAIDDIVTIQYYYNENFVFRQITFYLNDYTVSGNTFIGGSIFNQQNVNDVVGGFIIDERKHARICETSVNFKITENIGDTYKMPVCTDGFDTIFSEGTVSGTIGTYILTFSSGVILPNNLQQNSIIIINTEVFKISKKIDDVTLELLDVLTNTFVDVNYTIYQKTSVAIFYLNNYTVDGNQFVNNTNFASYLNDPTLLNASSGCYKLFFDIVDKQSEFTIERIKDYYQGTLGTVEFGMTFDKGDFTKEFIDSPTDELRDIDIQWNLKDEVYYKRFTFKVASNAGFVSGVAGSNFVTFSEYIIENDVKAGDRITIGNATTYHIHSILSSTSLQIIGVLSSSFNNESFSIEREALDSNLLGILADEHYQLNEAGENKEIIDEYKAYMSNVLSESVPIPSDSVTASFEFQPFYLAPDYPPQFLPILNGALLTEIDKVIVQIPI